MEPSTSTRARVSLTALVTLLVVLGEYVLLTTVYHMDDPVEDQRQAAVRVEGALDAWHPGAPTRPVEEAVRALAVRNARGSHRLQALTHTWAGSLDTADLDRVKSASSAVDRQLNTSKASVDRRAEIILATLLVVVSIGWFIWFRRLIQRHRELQRSFTEKQVLDSGG